MASQQAFDCFVLTVHHHAMPQSITAGGLPHAPRTHRPSRGATASSCCPASSSTSTRRCRTQTRSPAPHARYVMKAAVCHEAPHLSAQLLLLPSSDLGPQMSSLCEALRHAAHMPSSYSPCWHTHSASTTHRSPRAAWRAPCRTWPTTWRTEGRLPWTTASWPPQSAETSAHMCTRVLSCALVKPLPHKLLVAVLAPTDPREPCTFNLDHCALLLSCIQSSDQIF